MEAYSQPITPPPMTIMLLGMTSVERIESESQIVTSLKGISSGRRGRDPVAMTINGAVSKSLSLLLADTFRMCGSTNEAVPWMISTSFRSSWSVMTSCSCLMTRSFRAIRSRSVMFFFREYVMLVKERSLNPCR